MATMSELRVLAAYGHPDDEGQVTGTLATLIAGGAKVTLICGTRGEVGEISDSALATPETLGYVRELELRAAMAQIASHNGYARERYRVLKAKFAPSFRRNAVSTDVSELGRQIEEQTKQARRQRVETNRQDRVLRSIIGDAPAPSRLPESSASSVDRLAELLQTEGDDQPEGEA